MPNRAETSFVIRTKNEARYIGKVLDTLYKQTYSDFEVVIVDSGSEDETLEVIGEYPVRLLEIGPEEFGYSYALNLGIKEAVGKYIGIVSGHSVPLTRTWLEAGIKVIKEKKTAGLSGYYIDFALAYYWTFLGRIALLNREDRVDKDPWLTNTNALIKKKFWEKYPFDEELPECEDYDWAKEMLARGYNVVKLKDFSVVHSHLFLDRPGYVQRLSSWKRICALIDERERPRESFSKLQL